MSVRKNLGRFQIISSLVVLGVFISVPLLGFSGPWWLVSVPAAIGGFVLAFTRERSPTIGIALASALGWLFVALYADAQSGLRVSMRVGAVMGLPSSIFVYVLMLAIVASVSSFAALAGRNLALALRETLQSQLPSGK